MSDVENVRQVIQDIVVPQLREIRTRLDSIEKVMVARFDAIDAKFSALDTRFSAIDMKLEAIHTLNRFIDIERRLAVLEAKQVA